MRNKTLVVYFGKNSQGRLCLFWKYLTKKTASQSGYPDCKWWNGSKAIYYGFFMMRDRFHRLGSLFFFRKMVWWLGIPPSTDTRYNDIHIVLDRLIFAKWLLIVRASTGAGFSVCCCEWTVFLWRREVRFSHLILLNCKQVNGQALTLLITARKPFLRWKYSVKSSIVNLVLAIRMVASINDDKENRWQISIAW